MAIVSVLMSVYNNENFLRDSLESLRNQTFQDFDVWIVNDASTDNTALILDEYHFIFGDRFHVVTNSVNRYLAASLNEVLKRCQGEFVARMDGDDICFPERFSRQVEFLETNTHIGVLGTSCEYIDEEGNFLGEYCPPEFDQLIRSSGACTNPVVHPSVFIRRRLLSKVGGYNEQFRYSQDYELWSRLIVETRFHNLQEPLLKYRVFQNSRANRQRALYSIKAKFGWLKSQNKSVHNWLCLLRPLYWVILPHSLASKWNHKRHLIN